MSALPISLSAQGGPATSGVNDAGALTIQQPIVVVSAGDPSNILNSLNSLMSTVGNQNNVVASRYIPVAQAAVNNATPDVGNVGAVTYGSNSPLYTALGFGAVAVLLICFLFSKHR
jgi:hypothetical protein